MRILIRNTAIEEEGTNYLIILIYQDFKISDGSQNKTSQVRIRAKWLIRVYSKTKLIFFISIVMMDKSFQKPTALI
jgi:hypothetical protein